MHLHHFNIVQSIGLYLHACLCELSRLWSIVCVVEGVSDHERSSDGAHSISPPPTMEFDSIVNCVKKSREGEAVVAELEGGLMRSRDAFAYYMLVAFEAGSPVRGLVLLAAWPVIWAVRWAVSEAVALKMLMVVSMAGLRDAEVAGVGRAVLSRFFLDDLHPQAHAAFLSCTGTRCVLTTFPRPLVEPFLRHYLGAHSVLATDLHTFRGFCTGFVSSSPSLVGGASLRRAVQQALSTTQQPHLCLVRASSASAVTLLTLCKEGFVVREAEERVVRRQEYRRPLIFHDGRLVMRPTPLVSLFLYLWLPLGFALAIARLTVWCLLPAEVSVPLSALMGVRLRVKGSPPIHIGADAGSHTAENRGGVLYVCTHRTLLDPIFLSVALRRRLTAVTYSLSRLSELLSPIKTVRLSRRRDADAATIASLLRQGDLVICPEGTTCREPYLLRFSPLFAEITHDIVPVGIGVQMAVFHGTTARGFKAMDPFFFLMNPRPTYSITILDPLPTEETCASGRTSVEVANRIQRLMGDVMGYECTNLTRKDKYRVLAGNDGVVVDDVPLPQHYATTVVKFDELPLLSSISRSLMRLLSKKH